jgi:hypothetical protein
MALEALKSGQLDNRISSKPIAFHIGVKWCFEMQGKWPVLKTVMLQKDIE